MSNSSSRGIPVSRRSDMSFSRGGRAWISMTEQAAQPVRRVRPVCPDAPNRPGGGSSGLLPRFVKLLKGLAPFPDSSDFDSRRATIFSISRFVTTSKLGKLAMPPQPTKLTQSLLRAPLHLLTLFSHSVQLLYLSRDSYSFQRSARCRNPS